MNFTKADPTQPSADQPAFEILMGLALDAATNLNTLATISPSLLFKRSRELHGSLFMLTFLLELDQLILSKGVHLPADAINASEAFKEHLKNQRELESYAHELAEFRKPQSVRYILDRLIQPEAKCLDLGFGIFHQFTTAEWLNILYLEETNLVSYLLGFGNAIIDLAAKRHKKRIAYFGKRVNISAMLEAPVYSEAEREEFNVLSNPLTCKEKLRPATPPRKGRDSTPSRRKMLRKDAEPPRQKRRIDREKKPQDAAEFSRRWQSGATKSNLEDKMSEILREMRGLSRTQANVETMLTMLRESRKEMDELRRQIRDIESSLHRIHPREDEYNSSRHGGQGYYTRGFPRQ